MEPKVIALFAYLFFLIASLTFCAPEIGVRGKDEGQLSVNHHSVTPSKSIRFNPRQLARTFQGALLTAIRDRMYRILTDGMNLAYRILNSETEYSSLNNLTATFRNLLNSDGAVAFDRFFNFFGSWTTTYAGVVTGIEHVIARRKDKKEKKEKKESAFHNDEDNDDENRIDNPPGHRSDAQLVKYEPFAYYNEATSSEEDDSELERNYQQARAIAHHLKIYSMKKY